MQFNTDKQTLDDLKIFKGSDFSVFRLFHNVQTRGGAALLEQLFQEPMASPDAIRKRINIFRYFAGTSTVFPFSEDWFDQVEQYLANTDEQTKLAVTDSDRRRRTAGLAAVNVEQAVIQKGITALIGIVHTCRHFLDSAIAKAPSYMEDRRAMQLLLSGTVFERVLKLAPGKKLSTEQAADLDDQLRFRHQVSIRKLLERIYYLDVYTTVARIAEIRQFAFPTVLDEEPPSLRFKGLYHPALTKPVANSIDITPEKNVVFLTGANMAGKTTFMKALGIAVYLAHLGFPVPAEELIFSPLDGLYTTINPADDLPTGASHFYNEVLRVKKIALELNKGRHLLVIFDELFQGTNIKDAYEGTVAITEALASRRQGIFVISTHIVEAGAVLKTRCDNILFCYLPTKLQHNHPLYTYQLTNGITDDRYGMIIIRDSDILGILKSQLPSDRSFFATDNQTLMDLNLVGKHQRGSIYGLFCKVQTSPGERLLDQMFRNPLNDAAAINRRCELFHRFGALSLTFPLNREEFEAMANYLDEKGPANLMLSMAKIIYYRVTATGAKTDTFGRLGAGLRTTAQALRHIHLFLSRLAVSDPKGPYADQVRAAKLVLEEGLLGRMLKDQDVQKWGLFEIASFDHALKTTFRNRLQEVRALLTELDVFIAVGNLGRANGWMYAVALKGEKNVINITGLRHPVLPNAVGNSIYLDENSNVLLLTGANMTGKSTLMKAFGVAVYLAHMGFPVAANNMVFSVWDGLYSSINVADDLSLGYSQFYAEVLRLKKVAASVAEGKKLIILFDELFKGTNAEDAYEGTLAVTRAFATHQECAFIISTHIVEVGEALAWERNNIRLGRLPVIMEGARPRYTYVLGEGIAADRIGMTIIENEDVIGIINQ
jgi:DNA mismatch repair ATPase MutS